MWRFGRICVRPLAIALLLDMCAGFAVCRGRVLEIPLVQFELGARELVATD